MATGATGTPTTNYSIPKYATSADAPNGTGFNSAMDAIDSLLRAQAPMSSTIAGLVAGAVPVWNGTTWVKPSGTPDGTKFLRDDGTWAAPSSPAWAAFSPEWTADVTNPVINDGILTGRYVRIGNTVHGSIRMYAGSSTTFGSGGWSFSLPATAAAGNFLGVGMASITDASPFNIYSAMVRLNSTTTIQLATTASPTAQVAAAAPFTWTSGDDIGLTFTYEAA